MEQKIIKISLNMINYNFMKLILKVLNSMKFVCVQFYSSMNVSKLHIFFNIFLSALSFIFSHLSPSGLKF